MMAILTEHVFLFMQSIIARVFYCVKTEYKDIRPLAGVEALASTSPAKASTSGRGAEWLQYKIVGPVRQERGLGAAEEEDVFGVEFVGGVGNECHVVNGDFPINRGVAEPAQHGG